VVVTVRGRAAGRVLGIVGREAERESLLLALADDGPVVVFVHGIGGVGKSALLDAFAADARAAGALVLQLDGGAIEPTRRGFLAALSAATGTALGTTDDAAARLGTLADRVVIVVDRYEVLRPLDLWLQQSLPEWLPANTRIVLARREPPMPGWSLGMGSAFRAVAVGSLSREDARTLLRRDGVAETDVDPIGRLAHGHPLSLRLAAAAMAAHPGQERGAASVPAVVEALAERYLEGLDPATREALAAASVVRRPTLSLIRAMLPDVAPQDAFDRLRTLPFVTLGVDGLVIHDSVRDVVAAYVRASDPDGLRRYRIAAWRQLRDEVARAAPEEMWRYTADLLYILDNPMIREVFFPTTEHRYFVDRARPEDEAFVLGGARRRLPPALAEIVATWWRRDRAAVRVARDGSEAPAGFYVVGELATLGRGLLDLDPVARIWRDHLRVHPVARGERVLFDRFELVLEEGESAPLVQAAFMLDLKRMYMELRPHLRRIYSADRETIVGTAWERLGFQQLPGAPTLIDGVASWPFWLEFGPASVDGWLTRIIATELRVDDDSLLDVAQRQLVLRDGRVDLTRLEFEVFRSLYQRPGMVVDRASLLREVWGYDDDSGSNVVDAQVKSLRHKLGDRAGVIETVRGLGYRFVASV
jgi:DNA-binding response OmpR family regulator